MQSCLCGLVESAQNGAGTIVNGGNDDSFFLGNGIFLEDLDGLVFELLRTVRIMSISVRLDAIFLEVTVQDHAVIQPDGV